MKTAAILAVVIALVLAGCGTREGPSRIESAVAKQVKQKITIGGRDWKNPVGSTPENAKIGGEHFQHHCMICHGLDGHNTGVPFASRMDPEIPDLSSKDIQDYTDGQLKWIIQNGIAPSGMPSWKGILDDDEMWHIVAYIRNLPPKGSLGIPEVYKEAEEEHAAAEEKPRIKKSSKPSKTHPHHHH